ncbi:MAG: hypothetical protein IKY98_05740 [Alphaproteobacteria bacterium]|nr:hypothetical protein [Alphaproteobacteria bacterium]
MKKLLCAILLACGLSACGIGNTNTTYDRYNIGQQGSVSYGTIIAMNVVNVAGTKSVGTLGGAVAGGAAGSMIGGNTAVNIIGGVGGALLGGMVGSAAESAMTQDTAMEFIIQKQDGSIVPVVQSNELNLRVGDPVMLVTTGGKTRIRMRMY